MRELGLRETHTLKYSNLLFTVWISISKMIHSPGHHFLIPFVTKPDLPDEWAISGIATPQSVIALAAIPGTRHSSRKEDDMYRIFKCRIAR